MFIKEKRKSLTDVTVGEFLEAFKDVPKDLPMHCCGSNDMFLHIGDVAVSLDYDNLSEEYEENE